MAQRDAALLELLDAMELLGQRRLQLQRCLTQGWLSLSHARYTLGCHRVSALQYGATMEPRVRVVPRLDPNGGSPQFEEVSGSGGDPENVDPPMGGDGEGLRQRRGQEKLSGSPPEYKGGSPPPPKDPLRWFGVLVPPSLRQAQGSFQEAVALAVQLAGLQGAVSDAAMRYRDMGGCGGAHGSGGADTAERAEQ